MAQDPDRPLDSGRVEMPRVDNAMTRVYRGPPKVDDKRGALRTRGQTKRDREAEAARKDEILRRARKRFNRCVSAESTNRGAAVDDLKYKSGEGQWPANVVSERNFDQRPCITINKLPVFVRQVVNDQRMNRPAININPVGDRTDPEVAKMYRGLIRSMERQSEADIAYDTGFESAVSIGWGYWRFQLEYVSPQTFRQTIMVKRIINTFTVYLDPNSTEPDGADARFAFITERVPRNEFEEEWPAADPMPWTEGGFGEEYKEWITKDEIRIAEYFEIETKKRRLVMLANGHEGWWDELDEEAKKLPVLQDRDADYPTVMRYKLTAKDILEEQEWPGAYIPIVKCVGNEVNIEGKTRLSGLIRDAKSPQMLYNYHRTLSVELSSLQPKAPYVGAEGQFEGHETQWKQANNKAYPYLEYKPTDLNGQPLPPPTRQPFQGAPQAVLAEVQAAATDMMAVTGIRFDATPGERMYDESGRALRELRERGDLGSFHYIDNFARSLRRTGEIFVDLIPKVLEQKQVVTILREDDSEEQVQVDPRASRPYQEMRNPQTGKTMKIFNPTYGKYGVTVTIGPSYATKRIEAGESMMDFVRALAPAAPQLAAGVADLVAKYQDWPGGDEFAARLAKMLPPNLLAPEIKDVPPQVQALLQNMQQQLQAAAAEKAQLVQALTEQQSDRAQRQDKIERDFEAKLLNIVAQVETKMAAVQQKQDQAIMDRVMGPIGELARGVQELRMALMPVENMPAAE